MPSVETLIAQGKKLDFIQSRPDKGVEMAFFSDVVVKYHTYHPVRGTIEENQTRMTQEVSTYQYLVNLKCDFIPHFIDYSIEEEWFCIERIPGQDLLSIFNEGSQKVPVKYVIDQLLHIQDWLDQKNVRRLGKLKDTIMDSRGRLYLVDFEKTRIGPRENDVDDLLISGFLFDLAERWVVRRGRKAKTKWQFIRISIGLFMVDPLLSFRIWWTVIWGYIVDDFKRIKETIKQYIKGELRRFFIR
jgi:predicted Ser/Thr protein kinase